MQRHDVGARQQVVERDQLDAGVAVLGAELHIGVGHEDPAAEGAQQLDHLGADVAVADDADGHLVELAAGAVGAVEVAAPFAPAQRLVADADQPRLGKDRADGEFGDGAGVAAGRVDHA